MSLKPHPADLIPEETARIAQAAFPQGNLYLHILCISPLLESEHLC
jgi:hypothetical protein